MLQLMKEKTPGKLNKTETITLQEALTKLKKLFVRISGDNN
jgi:hypothetical protein